MPEEGKVIERYREISRDIERYREIVVNVFFSFLFTSQKCHLLLYVALVTGPPFLIQ